MTHSKELLSILSSFTLLSAEALKATREKTYCGVMMHAVQTDVEKPNSVGEYITATFGGS